MTIEEYKKKKNSLKEYLKDHFLILDGGMGTLLYERGLAPGESPERRNLTHPEDVIAIHRAYFDAGANVVYTNTFGANSLHFEKDELAAIITAAVENAKFAASCSSARQAKWVALDIGPTGRMLKPYGDLDFEDAVAVFAETVKAGARAGADLVVIETMNDSYETKAALLAAKENCTLPVFVTNAYGEDGKLMTGADPAAMVALLEGLGADAIGVNCSLGPKQLAPVVEAYLRYASVPVIVKPNAGLPKVVDGKTVYDVTPEDFAHDVFSLAFKGARVVGGCCGTTPAYIAQLKKTVGFAVPKPIIKKTDTVISSYTHAVFFGGDPVLIGERINPTGKKRMKQALLDHDLDYILSEAASEEEKGIPVLDVNVGLPEIDESALLPEVIKELQAVTALPLQIDTASPAAMEKAMRIYNGKPLVNSVNGKQESMDAVFPLVKKYGGAVIALTLDEKGIPETAEGRVRIAKKILKEAERHGISKKDIIFDTLTMTVSASPDAAAVTLKALRTIREKLGCHTLLGVSNVSFGLPNRDVLNSTFFASALANGLSAAIMNPNSADMMRTYYAHRALTGRDENFTDYIARVPALSAAAAAAPGTSAPGVAVADGDGKSALCRAVIKGFRKQAGELAKSMIAEGIEPLDVVNKEIIPALNSVGEGFEKKTMFLPQLLMSAEAAAEAFEAVKNSMQRTADNGLPFVLATVKGDIHDIGKNIVKLLLENYGFRVIDLGKDVPPETVVCAVKRENAPIAGLSALMTTTVPAMEETIKLLRKETPDCRIVVGGAVLTKDYAEKIGADAYAKDAMETVRYAEAVRNTIIRSE